MATIILPVDFGKTTDTLLAAAVKFAKEIKGKICLIHVAPVDLGLAVGDVGMQYFPEIEQSEIKEELLELNKLEQRVIALGVDCEHLLKQLREDLIIKWTYNSNAIEGSTFTLMETKVLLEDGITVGGKTMREHLEIIGHAEAIYYLEEIIKDDTELSEKEIRNIHSLVTKGIENINPGQYRIVPVYISGAEHIPPQPYMILPEMEKLILWYRNEANELHPIERATILHGEFVKIHPFLDGNGRTSRLLLNFELMKNGYPPIIIEKSERAIYFESLEKGSLTGDWTDFIQFVAKKCEERIDFINSFKEKETK